MFARRRPLLRAAVVGGGAYMVGKKSGERKAEAEQSQQDASQQGQQDQQGQQGQAGQQGQQAQPAQGTQPAHAPKPSPAGQPPISDQLKQLTDLHSQGALSDAEFTEAKSRLLGG